MRSRKLLCILVSLIMMISLVSIPSITANAGPAAGQEYDLKGLNPDDATVKPTLTISSEKLSYDEAKSSPTRDVTLSVKGAADKYAPTGLHIQFDSRLKIVTKSVGGKTIYAKLGDAGEHLSQEQQGDGDNGFFLATAASDDVGQDGVLWKFQVTLPNDIDPAGDFFPIEIVYKSKPTAEDRFINGDKDEQGQLMQAYVFTKGIHQGGITVEAEPQPWVFNRFDWEGNATDGYSKVSAVYTRNNDTQSKPMTLQTNVIEPTCESGGKTTYKASISAAESLDGIARETENRDAKETPAKNHDWQFTEFTWVGNETTGYTDVKANYVCKNDSSHTDYVEFNPDVTVTDPTCESGGKTTYVAKISAADSLDGKAHESDVMEALATPESGHDWQFAGFSWTGDALTGYTAVTADYVCKNHSNHKKSVDVTPQTTVTDPTCESGGKTTYVASISAADSLDKTAHKESKDALVTKALGHDWEFTGFTWTGDDTNGYTAATAEYVCKSDSDHKKSVNVTPQVDEVPPTSEADGITTYKVSVSASDSLDGAAHNDSKEVVKKRIPKLDYKNEWVNGQWYDANGKDDYEPKGSWKSDSTGWWYEDTSGWYAINTWQKIDGSWYYFNSDGYMATNEFCGSWVPYIVGYWWVGADGKWDGSNVYQWHLAENEKWWFGEKNGWYAKDASYTIGEKAYDFDSEGYYVE